MSESESDSSRGGELATHSNAFRPSTARRFGAARTVSLPLESLLHGCYSLGEENLLVRHGRRSVGRAGPQLGIVIGIAEFAEGWVRRREFVVCADFAGVCVVTIRKAKKGSQQGKAASGHSRRGQ